MKTPIQQLMAAVNAADAEAVTHVLSQHPDLRADQRKLRLCLENAGDDVAVIEALVNSGADINAGESEQSPEGVIVSAIDNGEMNAVRWMLARGAKLNHEVDGQRRSFALTGAVLNGDLDLVKLLIAHGADPNAVWRKDSNALSFAIMYGQREIEQYLRSIGAKEPRELVGGSGGASPAPLSPPTTVDRPLLDHIRKHLGEPAPLSLQQIAQSDVPISVHLVRLTDGSLALVTTGMSARPLAVSKGNELFRHAELVIYLPGSWPTGPAALADPRHAWPYQWMQRLAAYPHQHES